MSVYSYAQKKIILTNEHPMISWPFKIFHLLKMEIFDKEATTMMCWLQGKIWLFLDTSLNNNENT